jgi:hypothetical protein
LVHGSARPPIVMLPRLPIPPAFLQRASRAHEASSGASGAGGRPGASLGGGAEAGRARHRADRRSRRRDPAGGSARDARAGSATCGCVDGRPNVGRRARLGLRTRTRARGDSPRWTARTPPIRPRPHAERACIRRASRGGSRSAAHASETAGQDQQGGTAAVRRVPSGAIKAPTIAWGSPVVNRRETLHRGARHPADRPPARG